MFFLLAKQYAINAGLLPKGPNFRIYRRVATLERAVLLGVVLFFLGAVGLGWAVWSWQAKAFGQLDYASMMRLLIPAVAALALGVQIVMASFLAGILDLPIRYRSGSRDDEGLAK